MSAAPSGVPRQPRQRRVRLWQLLPLAILGMLYWLSAAAGATPDARDWRDLSAAFGFSEDQQRDVARGRTVAVDAPAVLPNELAVAGATRLPVPVDRFAERLRDGIPITADPYLRGFARTDPDPPADAWAEARLGAADREEALALFDVEPGLAFNLSTAEILRLRAALPEDAPGAQDLQGAADAFREVLRLRHNDYRHAGLNGLAGYDRGGELSLPGEQLQRIEEASPVPAVLAPLLAQLRQFPSDSPGSGSESRLYWKKTLIENRPAFVLSQVMVAEDPDAVRFALREYYVSHTYNVLQQAGIAVPDGASQSVMLLVNSTVTDRIGGLFSGLVRVIGQARSRDALEQYMIRVRQQSAAAAAP